MKKLKAIIYTILCNNVTGYLIKLIYNKYIPDIRWKKYSFVSSSLISNEMAAAVYFGFYESAEIRFIEKYLKGNLDVIELGASIGIVSSHIVRKLNSGTKFIMIEANPNLQTVIASNISNNKAKNDSYHILNYAICYGSETALLNITNNNTDGNIIKSEKSYSTIPVKTITLSSVIKQFNIQKYAIVSDIEGSEIEWLLNENESLENCKQLLIELHDTVYNKYYSINDMKEIIIRKHKFKLIESTGPVFYFEK